VDLSSARAQAHTILVVEDQPPLRGLLREALEAAGYEVVEAWHGAQAIEAIDRSQPPARGLCLILLDLFLPYVDGLGVLQHLAARRIFVPVVAVSAHPDLLEEAAASGAKDTLAKPFDVDELLATVSRYCPLVHEDA
jgi:CheY-like chemotaxis protein